MKCHKCGERIFLEEDKISYHKPCWEEFQQELIAVARGKQWRKIGETTEYYEE